LFENDGDGLDHGNDGDGDSKNVRFAYRESSWSKNHETYNPKSMPFVDKYFGLMEEYIEIPLIFTYLNNF
jgi:hypothetical protein